MHHGRGGIGSLGGYSSPKDPRGSMPIAARVTHYPEFANVVPGHNPEAWR